MTYTTERNGVVVAPPIAPGLLARMTPDQRSRAEARLRARAAQGLQIRTKQFCLTEERLRNAVFESEPGQTCQRTTLTSTSKLQEFHEECTQSGDKRAADGRFEAIDSARLKGLLKVKAEGHSPFTLNMEIAGHWVSSDCGESAQ